MAMVAVMASCGGNTNTNANENADSTAAPVEEVPAPACDTTCSAACDSVAAADLSKAFVCPANCESSDTEGQCSKCGADLVENTSK